jgi:hypothetical protein
MKITKRKLERLIKEEISRIVEDDIPTLIYDDIHPVPPNLEDFDPHEAYGLGHEAGKEHAEKDQPDVTHEQLDVTHEQLMQIAEQVKDDDKWGDQVGIEDDDWGGHDQFDEEAAEQAADFDEKFELKQEKATFLNDISKRWYDEFNITGGTDLFDDYAGSDIERKQKMIDKLLSDAYDELMTAIGADAARSDMRYR